MGSFGILLYNNEMTTPHWVRTVACLQTQLKALLDFVLAWVLSMKTIYQRKDPRRRLLTVKADVGCQSQYFLCSEV